MAWPCCPETVCCVKKAGNLTIVHRPSGSSGWQRLLAFLLLLGLGGGLFYAGQWYAGYEREQARQTERGLRDALAEFERQNAVLRDRIAVLTRSNEVDRRAYERVGEEFQALQREIAELREEVNFYRGIVSPRENSTGLRVERFELEKAPGQERMYHYRLVLTQVLKNQRSVRGTAFFSIEGLQAGKPQVLKLKRIAADKKTSLRFRFRYFQKFEGDIVLPKGFQPRQVTVTIQPHKRKQIRRSYPWPGEGEPSKEEAA